MSSHRTSSRPAQRGILFGDGGHCWAKYGRGNYDERVLIALSYRWLTPGTPEGLEPPSFLHSVPATAWCECSHHFMFKTTHMQMLLIPVRASGMRFQTGHAEKGSDPVNTRRRRAQHCCSEEFVSVLTPTFGQSERVVSTCSIFSQFCTVPITSGFLARCWSRVHDCTCQRNSVVNHCVPTRRKVPYHSCWRRKRYWSRVMLFTIVGVTFVTSGDGKMRASVKPRRSLLAQALRVCLLWLSKTALVACLLRMVDVRKRAALVRHGSIWRRLQFHMLEPPHPSCITATHADGLRC